MSLLPKEYKQLQWLQSTGTQYIDLPFNFNTSDSIEFKFSEVLADQEIDKFMISGKPWSPSNNRFAMGRHKGAQAIVEAGIFTCGCGNLSTGSTYLIPATPMDDNPYVWHYQNSVFSVEGLDIKFENNQTFTSSNLSLFYGYESPTKGKIYYYKHTKSNISYILLPAERLSDHKYGMYDTVNGVFYTNAATSGDDFIPGPYAVITVNKSFYKQPSKLPSEYTELEYLQSTGTQIIDLNISGNARAIIDAQCESNAHVVLSSTVGATAGTWIGSYSNKDYWTVGSSIFFTVPKTTRSVIDATFSNSGVTATIGSETKTNTQTVTQGNWTLFACGSMGFTFAGKVWSCKMYQNDALVRNMIPARRNSDSEIGMYDTVTNTFFTNAGTDTFIAGPEVTEEPTYISATYDLILPSPLHKISTYKDSIESDGVITRGIGKTILSAGTHTISDAVSNSPYLCTQQAAGTLSGQDITLATGVTNAEVYYALATEGEEEIVVPTITTIKGDQILECATDLAPTYFEATYRKRTKPED